MSDTIKDTGNRVQFASGAVRDIHEGKGRTDLIPLDIVSPLMGNEPHAQVMYHLGLFMNTLDAGELYLSILAFCELKKWTPAEMLLEVSHHYEDGCNKYGERNWEKGILLHSYIDSGVRHYLKHIDGYNTDERHDRAFIWNMLGAIWTLQHRPECIDIEIPTVDGV